MLGQLGPKCALDQGLLELLEQPVLAGQVFGLAVVRKKLVQQFRGDRRIGRHVSLQLKVNSQKPPYTSFRTPSPTSTVGSTIAFARCSSNTGSTGVSST